MRFHPARATAHASPDSMNVDVSSHSISGWAKNTAAARRATGRPASRSAAPATAATATSASRNGANAPCTESQSRKPSRTSISTVNGSYEDEFQDTSKIRPASTNRAGSAAWYRSASGDEIGAQVAMAPSKAYATRM